MNKKDFKSYRLIVSVEFSTHPFEKEFENYYLMITENGAGEERYLVKEEEVTLEKNSLTTLRNTFRTYSFHSEADFKEFITYIKREVNSSTILKKYYTYY